MEKIQKKKKEKHAKKYKKTDTRGMGKNFVKNQLFKCSIHFSVTTVSPATHWVQLCPSTPAGLSEGTVGVGWHRGGGVQPQVQLHWRPENKYYLTLNKEIHNEWHLDVHFYNI